MTLRLIGEGTRYINGVLIVPNGKYRLRNADIVIGDNGIEIISNGEFQLLEEK